MNLICDNTCMWSPLQMLQMALESVTCLDVINRTKSIRKKNCDGGKELQPYDRTRSDGSYQQKVYHCVVLNVLRSYYDRSTIRSTIVYDRTWSKIVQSISLSYRSFDSLIWVISFHFNFQGISILFSLITSHLRKDISIKKKNLRYTFFFF